MGILQQGFFVILKHRLYENWNYVCYSTNVCSQGFTGLPNPLERQISALQGGHSVVSIWLILMESNQGRTQNSHFP